MAKMIPRPLSIGAVCVFGIVVLSLPLFLDNFWISNAVQIMVFGLLALSVSLLAGHLNMVSLGHAAFFAVAAYTTAYTQVVVGISPPIAIVAGVLASVLLALIFSFAVRTHNVYFMLLTLAMGMVVWGLATRWTSVTQGDNGIRNVRLPQIFGVELSQMSNYYYIVLVVVGLSILAYRQLVNSPLGLILRGTRESDSRMQTIGYNVNAYRLIAFVISSFIAGVSGVLYVYWNAFVSPPTALMVVSAEAKLMSIIGGSTTVIGSWLGATIITVIRNYVSSQFDRYMSVMGIVFIITALYFPKGLLGKNPQPTVHSTVDFGARGMNHYSG